ncbi:MAG TPA: ABC transporter substrate-binding protein [Solirubrobacterales bacterium]|nr:ABC transporter substrate-binding protein [Solirubrobacterales bacterium]
MASRLRGALIIAALAALAGTGCGGSEGEDIAAPGSTVQGSGTLVYALAGKVRELDPLLATSRSELLVTRQLHEPLVASLTGPFGEIRRSRGLAIAWRSTPDREIWSFRLRMGIRFQDGTPLNAAAVLANAERWRTLEAGRELLPELVAADAPRPDLVRFILSRPVPDFAERLASPRLGIVSPRALRPHSGTAAQLLGARRSGTGPFELRERLPRSIVLAGNTEWWGTRLDLGPALDQLQFEVVPALRDRLDVLEAGEVQVADGLDPGAIGELRSDPLLTFVKGKGGAVLGMERSVRGIDSATAIEPLSDVWLTVVGTQ